MKLMAPETKPVSFPTSVRFPRPDELTADEQRTAALILSAIDKGFRSTQVVRGEGIEEVVRGHWSEAVVSSKPRYIVEAYVTPAEVFGVTRRLLAEGMRINYATLHVERAAG